MNRFLFHVKTPSTFKNVNIFVVLFLLFFSKAVVAANIEPYDFADISFPINKHWQPEVALHVAKKFIAEHDGVNHTVTVTQLKAGASNHFIYLVFVDSQMKFVIKGLSSKKEAEALFTLQHNTKVNQTKTNPNAANVCLSKMIRYYLTTDDKQLYYFAILEAAEGKEVFKLMVNELLKTHDIPLLETVFYDMGRQLSEFHKSIVGEDHFISPNNLKTIIHDDLHPENSFYHFETKQFSLIDNDSMGETISAPLPLVRELYGLYEIPIIRWPSEKISIDLLKDADPHEIATIYIALIKGMSSVYTNPEEAQSVFIHKILELNSMELAYLKDSTSEPWMLYPSDKSEDHIVWGKLSHAVYNKDLNQTYQTKLSILNAEFGRLLNQQ